jgi:hypothetical protein
MENESGFMYKLSALREFSGLGIDASAATIQPDSRGK